MSISKLEFMVTVNAVMFVSYAMGWLTRHLSGDSR